MTLDTLPTKSKRKAQRDIEREIAEQRAALAAREISFIDDIDAMYNKALDAIEIAARRIAAQTTVSSQIMRSQLLSLVDDITAQMTEMDLRVVDRVQIESRFAMLRSTGDVTAMLQALGLQSHLNVAAATRATAGVQAESSPLLRLLARKSVDAGVAAREALIVGTIKGDNPIAVARNLRKALVGPKYSAERIARTEVLRNYRGASRESMAQSGVATGWIWVSARDARTCAFCWAQHGKRYDLHDAMPTHPNCRCSQAPAVGGGQDIIKSGVTSFERLPATTKKQILGSAKYDAFNKGEIALRDLVGFKQHPDWGVIGYEKSLLEIRRG